MVAFNPVSLNRMIRDHGVVFTLRKRAASAYNVTTGTVSQTNTDTSVRGYLYNNKLDALSGANLQGGKSSICLSGLTTGGIITPEPDATDQIVAGSLVYDILSVQAIRSGSVTLCYLLTLKD